MAAAERFLVLARDLRMAALGRDGNPPGVSRHSVGSLGGRIDALAAYLPPCHAAVARTKAARLGTQDVGLTPAEALELARWLEAMAVHAQPAGAGARATAPAAAPSGGDAA